MKITRILAFVQPLCLSTSLLTPSESPPSVFNRLESIIVKGFSLRQPQHEKAAKRPTKFECAKDCISGYRPWIDLASRPTSSSAIRTTRLHLDRLEFTIVKPFDLRQFHRNQQEEDPQNPSLRRTISPATDLRFNWFQAPTTPPVCERQDHSLGLAAGTVFEAPEDHHCQVLEEVF